MGKTPQGTPEEGGYKSPSIGTLWPHHKSIARLFIEGLQPSEVARITGFTEGQISRILGSPVFQVELGRLSALADENAVTAAQIILEHAPRAACVLVEDLYQNTEDNDKARSSRQAAAKDILDRTGIAKRSEPKGGSKQLSMTQINIGEMKTKDLFTEVMELVEEAS